MVQRMWTIMNSVFLLIMLHKRLATRVYSYIKQLMLLYWGSTAFQESSHRVVIAGFSITVMGYVKT